MGCLPGDTMYYWAYAEEIPQIMNITCQTNSLSAKNIVI